MSTGQAIKRKQSLEWREIIFETTSGRKLHYKEGNAYEPKGIILLGLHNAFALLRSKPVLAIKILIVYQREAKYKRMATYAILVAVHVHLFSSDILRGVDRAYFTKVYREKIEDLYFQDNFAAAKYAIRASLGCNPDGCSFYMRTNKSICCLCPNCVELIRRRLAFLLGCDLSNECIQYLKGE